MTVTLPEGDITGNLNDEAKGLMHGDWNMWEAAGFIKVCKEQFDLTYQEWRNVWRRYPGPVSDEDYFYTKDPAFRGVTTEHLRDALKVLQVEEAL